MFFREIAGTLFASFALITVTEPCSAKSAPPQRPDLGCAISLGVTQAGVGTYLYTNDHDNAYIPTGSCLISPDNNSFVAMQGDGNFVVYSPRGNAGFRTHTDGILGAEGLLLQDGRIAIYAAGTVQKTGTTYNADPNGGRLKAVHGNPGIRGDYILIMMDGGGLAIYHGESPENHGAWTFHTHASAFKNPYCLVLLEKAGTVLERNNVTATDPVMVAGFYGQTRTKYMRDYPAGGIPADYRVEPGTCPVLPSRAK